VVGIRTLYIITLEKLTSRYTVQWYNYWKPEFSKFFNVEYIDGIPNDEIIEKGRFLDINKTNKWKAEQVIWLSNLFQKGKIKDDDIFLFADGWHFGVTALKYMIQLQNSKAKIFAYFHAGTYDPHDFISQAGLGNWACYNEIGWFKALDGIFVATRFHKKLITQHIKKYLSKDEKFHYEKICVVGFPMNWIKEMAKEGIDATKYKEFQKKDLIVFPHRLDKEKQPHIFDNLKRVVNCKYIKTIEKTKTKKEYYEILKEAKVVFSASLQETYGIGTVEGIILGCIPIVPNRLSYMEMYDKIYRYENIISARHKVKNAMNGYNCNDAGYIKVLESNRTKIINASLQAIPKMARVMLR
jgi:hypothetical protein